MSYPKPLEELIAQFETLPGIGRRTAERLALFLLQVPEAEALRFAETVRAARLGTKLCSNCWNLGESDPCRICADPQRDRNLLCVVEEPKDVESIEKAEIYRGLYHVLQGALNPAHGSKPEQLTIDALVARVKKTKPAEVILATDPDFEGDGTALLVSQALKPTGVRLTRLARGAPPGTSLVYLNRAILTEALEGRRPL